MLTKRAKSLISITAGIAILVALSGIAFLVWRNHQAEANVADALQAADAAKLVVMEAATISGGLANIQAKALPAMPFTAESAYVRSIHIADGGLVTVATQFTGTTPDPVLVLVPANGAKNSSSVITWTCTLAAGNASAVPLTCRNAGAAPAGATPAEKATTSSSSD